MASRIVRASLILTAASLVLSAAPAAAGKGKGKESFIFLVSKVEVEKKAEAPAKVVSEVKKSLATAIAANPDIESELPAGAPDPGADPKAFEAFMKRRKMRAFKVNVEITDYSRELDPDVGKPGQMLTVHVALRMFGETIPKRVMAFTGDGSATIKLEIGKKLRPRDDEVAHHDAVELAVADALAMSLTKLREGPPKRKK